jgi:hypothetical protein
MAGCQSIAVVMTREVALEITILLRQRHSYAGAQTFIRRVLSTLNPVYLDETARHKAPIMFDRVNRERKIFKT